jgi:hypothetical protein
VSIDLGTFLSNAVVVGVGVIVLWWRMQKVEQEVDKLRDRMHELANKVVTYEALELLLNQRGR